MRTPVCIAELIRDQRVSGLRIGHAQERFGQAQQRDAFGGIKPVFLQELIDPTAVLRRAEIANQPECACMNRRHLPRRQPRASDQRREHIGFWCAV